MHTPSSIRPALLSCPEWISGDDAGRRGFNRLGQQHRQQEEGLFPPATTAAMRLLFSKWSITQPNPKRCGISGIDHERVEDSHVNSGLS